MKIALAARKLYGNEYHRAYMDYKRYKKRTTYFTEWNLGRIIPRLLKEEKIFTAADLYYIKKNNPS